MILQYYQRPFALFHATIGNLIKPGTEYLRKKFWNKIPDGKYSGIDAQDLLWSYAKSLEESAAQIIGKYSIAYWIHLSRRIAVNSGGENKDIITINTNRLNIVALIQKYGNKESCNYIKNSKEIEISEILNGLLLNDNFHAERELIKLAPAQFVLTNFDHNNIIEYYQVEKIAYELWVCGAKLRAIGKGALIIVNKSSKE